MSRRLIAASWLSVFVVAGLMGHLTAQKLHAIPAKQYCPYTDNTNCPTCDLYFNPGIGQNVGCHMTAGSYTTCTFPGPGRTPCGNFNKYPCSGVQNTMMNCKGMDLKTTCKNYYLGC